MNKQFLIELGKVAAYCTTVVVSLYTASRAVDAFDKRTGGRKAEREEVVSS